MLRAVDGTLAAVVALTVPCEAPRAFFPVACGAVVVATDGAVTLIVTATSAAGGSPRRVHIGTLGAEAFRLVAARPDADAVLFVGTDSLELADVGPSSAARLRNLRCAALPPNEWRDCKLAAAHDTARVAFLVEVERSVHMLDVAADTREVVRRWRVELFGIRRDVLLGADAALVAVRHRSAASVVWLDAADGTQRASWPCSPSVVLRVDDVDPCVFVACEPEVGVRLCYMNRDLWQARSLKEYVNTAAARVMSVARDGAHLVALLHFAEGNTVVRARCALHERSDEVRIVEEFFAFRHSSALLSATRDGSRMCTRYHGVAGVGAAAHLYSLRDADRVVHNGDTEVTDDALLGYEPPYVHTSLGAPASALFAADGSTCCVWCMNAKEVRVVALPLAPRPALAAAVCEAAVPHDVVAFHVAVFGYCGDVL